MSDSFEQLKEIIVLGAGVIGLTTAIKIQERGGYHVTVVAEVFPSDPKSTRYTSHWAGAHHVSLSGDDVKQQRIDRETFDVMWELSAPGSPAEACFLRSRQEEYYSEEAEVQRDPLEFMPDFKVMPRDSIVHAKAVRGISFQTVNIDVQVYLNYLLARLLAAGASIVRGTVQHIDQLVEGGTYPFTGARAGPRSPDGIIVCTGLGARALGGIEDKDVFAVRGQTVLLWAPWVRFGRKINTKEGSWTYVMPRRCGEVMVGGTKEPNDWYPRPRPETTRDILMRGLELVSELAPPEIRSIGKPTVDDLLPLIIEEGCGLRPARNGGIRLEMEWANSARDKNNDIPIVHNYGHGSHGYISSWGSASVALKLLEGALAKRERTFEE